MRKSDEPGRKISCARNRGGKMEVCSVLRATVRVVGDLGESRSVREAARREEWAGSFSFGGQFQAKHELAPRCVTRDKVVRLCGPAGVREAELRAAVLLHEVEEQPRAIPLLARIAQPVRAQRRCDLIGAEAVQSCAIEEAELNGTR